MKLPAARPVRKGVKPAFRHGSVPYLNAKPLCWTLPGARLEHPPQLLALLESGEVDAALLSSIEWLRRPDRFDWVRGLGVVSDGPVESVRLYHRRPLREVRRVGLDPHSLTANALVRIVLALGSDSRPAFASRRGKSWRDFDATVVIGDDAFAFGRGDYLDLGAEWKRLTGLPFVYALWIYPQGLSRTDRLTKELREAAEAGARRLEEIADKESARLRLDKAFCLRYLTERVKYQVGPLEEKGLELFGRYLKELDLQ